MDKTKWPHTPHQKILLWLAVALYLVQIVVLVLFWNQLPDKVPAHFGFSGQPDRWGDKSSLLVLPIIGGLLFGMLLLIEHFPSIWNSPGNTVEERARYLPLTRTLLLWEMMVLNGTFCYISLTSMAAKPLSPWFLPVCLVLVFGSIVWYVRAVNRLKKDQIEK